MAQKTFRFCVHRHDQVPRIYYFKGALGLNQEIFEQISVQDNEEIVTILDFKMDKTIDTFKVSRLHPDKADVYGIRLEDFD